MASILTNTKKLLGISESDTSFDTDITIHINTAFATLNQLGVGPDDPYYISGSGNLWSEFSSDESLCDQCQNYIYLKTRSVFDPPTSSYAVDSMNNMIKELEWRLNVKEDVSDDTSE